MDMHPGVSKEYRQRLWKTSDGKCECGGVIEDRKCQVCGKKWCGVCKRPMKWGWHVGCREAWWTVWK
jgi:hypothetical protein